MMSFVRNAVLAMVMLFVSFAAFAKPVDINTASATEIAEALSGVAQSKAEAIVAYRKEHGPFNNADELAMVKGIGAKTVEKNRDNIVVTQEENK
jgi:competence protein ComEA